MGSREGRFEERVEIHKPAYITTSDGKALVALLCDISRSGGRLKTNRSLDIGSEITVRMANKVERVGVVRRCRPIPEENKFDLGLELLGNSWPDEVLKAEVA
jgi:hypothetical protein